MVDTRAIIHIKWRSNIKTSHRILRKQSPLSPRNDQPTSLTIARQSYIYQASSFSFMNSINQLRNYISRKKQCVSLNPSQLSLDSINCIRARSQFKKKIRFSSIFLCISFPPEYSLFLSPSLIYFSFSCFSFVQSPSPSSSLDASLSLLYSLNSILPPPLFLLTHFQMFRAGEL